jgi:2-iminobutanoate/2-iminopropanoate deaminase
MPVQITGMDERLRRKSIRIDSYSHGKTPIPAASRIGPFIASGNIGGFDVARGGYAADAAEQTRQMFENLRDIVTAAGATLDDVLKMTVYVRDDSYRALLDMEWLKAFPDRDTQPARQTILHKDLPAGRLISCDILAVANE